MSIFTIAVAYHRTVSVYIQYEYIYVIKKRSKETMSEYEQQRPLTSGSLVSCDNTDTWRHIHWLLPQSDSALHGDIMGIPKAGIGGKGRIQLLWKGCLGKICVNNLFHCSCSRCIFPRCKAPPPPLIGWWQSDVYYMDIYYIYVGLNTCIVFILLLVFMHGKSPYEHHF